MSKKEIDKKITEITDKIVREFKPEKIILFGSYAWGEPNKDSDIDLFVIKKTDTPRQCARDIDGSVFPRLIPMDILVSSPDRVKERLFLGDRFVRQIINSGKVLYEKQ